MNFTCGIRLFIQLHDKCYYGNNDSLVIFFILLHIITGNGAQFFWLVFSLHPEFHPSSRVLARLTGTCWSARTSHLKRYSRWMPMHKTKPAPSAITRRERRTPCSHRFHRHRASCCTGENHFPSRLSKQCS